MDKIVKKSQAPPKQTSFTTRNTGSTVISAGILNRAVISQPTPQGSSTGPASNTRNETMLKQTNSDVGKKETWSQWAKGNVSKLVDTPFMAIGVSSDKPQQFKSGDRVVLQSANDTAIYGTVRWVGDVILHGQSVSVVGIETVS